MTILHRAAQTLLALFGLLITVILASVYAAGNTPGPGRTSKEDQHLIATAGIGFGLLVIVLATAGIGSGERWAWLALWVLPAFFLSHCILLGTWLPDGVFLVLSVAALTITRPRYGDAPAPA